MQVYEEFLEDQSRMPGLCVCASEFQDLLSRCNQRLASDFGEQTISCVCLCFNRHVDYSLCRIPVSDWTLVLKFLSIAGITYVKQSRELKFIPDLLKIHIPGLIHPSSKDEYPSNSPTHLFKTRIRSFINFYALKEGVRDGIPTMLVQHINAAYALLIFMYMCTLCIQCTQYKIFFVH